MPVSLREALSQVVIAETCHSAADILREDDEHLTFDVGLPVNTLRSGLYGQITQVLSAVGDAREVVIEQTIPRVQPGQAIQAVPHVKNIIAVASGKGGVGKSTVAVNLALAMAFEGANVGILDADIYGPSQPHMLGVADQRPEVVDNRAIRPLRAHGVQMVSMGTLVAENTPMIWRGPMVSGALKQLLNQTLWEDVDYLIVDMPPGTGDIQLTLSQSVPVSSSIVVTTPQDIALIDAKKGIEMFRKVNIPVSGVVENMATYTCPKCGHCEAIFGEAGGEALAENYGTALLGRLPLRADIRAQVDGGRPPLVVDPDSEVSLEYRRIAMALAADVWTRAASGTGPNIAFVDD